MTWKIINTDVHGVPYPDGTVLISLAKHTSLKEKLNKDKMLGLYQNAEKKQRTIQSLIFGMVSFIYKTHLLKQIKKENPVL